MRNGMMALHLVALFLTVTTVALAAETPPGPPPGPPISVTPSHGNVVYVPGSTQPMHKLDIYTPTTPKPAGGYPLLVYVHGGGFARGDKSSPGDDFRTVLKALDKGYMVSSVNYRLSGTDKAPAQVVDVKAAVRFLRANAATYGFNADKIALVGVSAGASIAGVVTTSSDSTAFDTDLDAIGAVKGPANVRAAICLFGLYNFTTLQAQSDWLVNEENTSLNSKYLPQYAETRKFFLGKKAGPFNTPQGMEYQMLGGPLEASNPMTAKVSALTYIGAAEPPFFIRHGAADEIIPFLQSVDLAETLKAKGDKVDFALVPGAQHGIPGMNFFKVFDAEEMFTWLGQQM
jgi:acetyl esterase/lipase